MALPGFHELLHLLACLLSIIHILDDGIIATGGGQVRVLVKRGEIFNSSLVLEKVCVWFE